MLFALSQSCLELIASLVRRITVAQNKVTIEIEPGGLTKSLPGQEALSESRGKDHHPILIEVPVGFRRRGVEAKLVVLDQQQPTGGPDANLVKALTCAHKWFGMIARGEASGAGDIARAARLDRSYVTRLLCVAFLAPAITRMVMEQRMDLTTKQLIKSALKIPLLWPDQHVFLSSIARP